MSRNRSALTRVLFNVSPRLMLPVANDLLIINLFNLVICNPISVNLLNVYV